MEARRTRHAVRVSSVLGVGFRYHDPGFLISPGESTRLEPGMVITIEPGVYVPERGGGARIEDNVVVTESGREVLFQN
jgi:Xaa-Pro aminopeptidase